MTNSIKMTKSISAPRSEGLQLKTAGNLSMISMLAISVSMAAGPAQAQEMATPAMISPVQVSPAITPQPVPTTPTIAAPPASSPATVKTATTPSVNEERADDLASKGGFDAATVAPEALAQIEKEQQDRKAAAAKAAAASARAPVKTSTRASSGSTATSLTADGLGDDRIAAQQPGAIAAMAPTPAFGAEDAPATSAAIPNNIPTPETAASTEAFRGETDTDWNLLAALAALLGVGGAGAYAASRRRKSKGQAATAERSADPLPASLSAATLSEARRDRVEPQARPTVDAEQTAVQSLESKATTKADFAEFVANMPTFETPLDQADSNVTLGQRRVAAAPRPYLAKADLSRTAGYFTANVDAMPTPQNPFLTRQKRLKRARFLDGKLSGTKPSRSAGRTNITGRMTVSRALEPAFS